MHQHHMIRVRRVLLALGLLGIVVSGLIAPAVEAVSARLVSSPFVYRFQTDGVLDETNPMDNSSSPYWWLNAGGRLIIQGGVGTTIQGDLPATDKWYQAYAASNPRDTDGGAHPQNLFRLVTRSRWLNFQQDVYFYMHKLNVSTSPERNAWSGILLFNRYVDGNNVYYAGLRHDGAAIIKKKMHGVYHTLAQGPVFVADAPYVRDTNPNLLPGQRWMGLRSAIRTNADGSVTIQLFVDVDRTGVWVPVLQATDTDAGTDGAPLYGDGYAGIRTDYMDVSFDDYRVETLL